MKFPGSSFILKRARKSLFGFGIVLLLLLVVFPLSLRLFFFLNGLRSFHSRIGWDAEDYFGDAKVVALCKAIEAEDLEEMGRLVDAGADVNAVGKVGMTPLLWAFPDDKLARFEKMLELGADPNVPVSGDLKTRGTFRPGMTVTHIAAGSKFEGPFEAVMKSGGDPNLVDDRHQSPLHIVVGYGASKSKLKRIQILIDAGADLDPVEEGSTPVMQAIFRGQYEETLLLLEAGASMDIYKPRSNKKFVHFLAQKLSAPDRELLDKNMSAERRAALQKILKMVEDHGDDLEQAKKDVERWQNWLRIYDSAKYRILLDKEIAERVAEEE